MEENWKPIVGYEGIYEVSDQGRIKRIAPWSDGRKNRVRGIRKDDPNSRYGRINLFKDGKSKEFRIHRLVMSAFVGPLPWLHEVNHKNGDKRDNRLSNLEYVTHSANQIHSYRVLMTPTRPGSKHHGAKITEDDALAIRALRKRGWTLKKLSSEFCLSPSTICWIANGKAWKHI